MCLYLETINKDTFEMITTFVAITGLFITAIALYISINQFKKQLQLTFFAEYTRRYQNIMLNFPENINQPDFDFNDLNNDIRDKTLRYMRAYFDLCSEEYFLHDNKSIDDNTWNEWESGIKYAFSKTAFRKGWEIIKLDTEYYRQFTKFVNPLVLK